jgi:hypothetical protein
MRDIQFPAARGRLRSDEETGSRCSTVRAVGLANETLEHLRHRWVQIDLTLAAFGLQVIVNLTPPRLLADFDCGTVTPDAKIARLSSLIASGIPKQDF